MKKNNYSVPIRLEGNAAEKMNTLAALLETSIQKIANKLIESIADQAIQNTENFLNSFDSKNKKVFVEIFNGTLEQLNKNKQKRI